MGIRHFPQTLLMLIAFYYLFSLYFCVLDMKLMM